MAKSESMSTKFNRVRGMLKACDMPSEPELVAREKLLTV
jgi:hypothetical protein